MSFQPPGLTGDTRAGRTAGASQTYGKNILNFLVTGNVTFGPFYPPDRSSVSKERNLNRNQGMCEGEDVTDNGSKNRELHVSGVIRDSEVQALNSLLDESEPLDIISDAFKGEVHVKQGDYEGPTDWDPRSDEWLFEYSIDFVSTGREENDNDHGIIDDGSTSNQSGGGSSGGNFVR